MKGCSSDEVIWKTSVMIPIWANVKPNFSFRSGYPAGITDCIMSFSRWVMLIMNSIG